MTHFILLPGIYAKSLQGLNYFVCEGSKALGTLLTVGTHVQRKTYR